MAGNKKRAWAEWELLTLNRYMDQLEDQAAKAIRSYQEHRDTMDAAGRRAAVDWWDQVRRVLRWARSQLQ
jgi:hypothetical protein